MKKCEFNGYSANFTGKSVNFSEKSVNVTFTKKKNTCKEIKAIKAGKCLCININIEHKQYLLYNKTYMENRENIYTCFEAKRFH